MATKHIGDENFDIEVLSNSGFTLVDFWAEWCGPCKQLGPVLDEVANELTGKVTVAKVNIDENPDTPTKYGVRGIPTLILFKDGQPVATKVGSVPKSQLKEWIEAEIA